MCDLFSRFRIFNNTKVLGLDFFFKVYGKCFFNLGFQYDEVTIFISTANSLLAV